MQKAKEDASGLLEQKVKLEAEKKELEARADAMEKEMNKKLGTIGNLVHDSVPLSDNEVRSAAALPISLTATGQQRTHSHLGSRRPQS